MGNPRRGEKVLGAFAELKTLPGAGPPLWHVRGEQGKWHPEARLRRAFCVAKEFGLYAKGCRKGHIFTVGEYSIRLNLRKHIPFQCGEEMPGSLGEDKSGVSETTSESADVTWQEKSHGP